MGELKRLRTLDQAYAEIKRLDPDTAMSKNMLRNAILAGDIPFLQVRSKRLIALEDVNEYIERNIKGMKEHQEKGLFLV